ncbi:SDR family NAD(P)-dependent oxidoreductase [Alteromonas lipolytica]|uniref:20-beta-hydroxysteroid dehydrogenase n=1 Tax=Alteromonas lipolytica TaxID=1856405 RepID=A0A1E8FHG5_9ALTE|nr:SDR family NAD(P)-dependent oxidoreductase [Alteromonas lipolytica]OFI35048.1 20-beta-hydroxysteroid dehydrogenase [Alteromonas lipolytica]GGF56196.1 20-beta-hydroxysteroid dehydrogenase [Alteromonas lipolytica]
MTPVSLVTGGNRGIGFAIAEGLLKLGHKVLVAGRNEDEAERACQLLNGDAHPVVMDLASQDAIEDAITRATAIYSDIDILINNAGVMDKGAVTELAAEDWQRSFDVHVKGPATLTRLLLPAMLKNNYGRIINVSSGYGSYNEKMAGPPAYAVTKAALNALTVKTAAEVPVGANVKVNAMCPGWVHSRMGGPGAPLTPEEGADTALWLASLDSDSPNGMFFRQRKPIRW